MVGALATVSVLGGTSMQRLVISLCSSKSRRKSCLSTLCHAYLARLVSVGGFRDVATIPFLVLWSSCNAFLSSLGGGLGAGLRSNMGSDAADAAKILCEDRRGCSQLCEDSMVRCTLSFSLSFSTSASCESPWEVISVVTKLGKRQS